MAGHQPDREADHGAAEHEAAGEGFAKHQIAPEDAERRDEEGDREGAQGPDVGDQPEIEQIGEGGAEEPDRQHAGPDPRLGPVDGGPARQAVAEEGEGASLLRVRKYELAQVVRVGGELLTVEQIGALWHKDYDTINQAMGDAEKKLLEQSGQVLAEIKPNAQSERSTS